MFTGFPEETIRFFLELRFHNEATFFNAHRDEYERSVREPFYGFIQAMAPAVKQVADDMELRPDKCLARIRRDTRFSKDKTPYPCLANKRCQAASRLELYPCATSITAPFWGGVYHAESVTPSLVVNSIS